MEEREPALYCRGCGGEIWAGELYCALPDGPYCRSCLAILTRLAE